MGHQSSIHLLSELASLCLLVSSDGLPPLGKAKGRGTYRKATPREDALWKAISGDPPKAVSVPYEVT